MLKYNLSVVTTSRGCAMTKKIKHDADVKIKHDHKLFKSKPNAPIQTVTVNVTVNEKEDDCMGGCFKSLFGLGKKAATT